MKNKRLLIASLNKDEAITSCVIKHREKFITKIDILFLNELLKDYEYFDELNDKGSIIRWIKDGKVKFSNKSHLILNLIPFIPEELFSQFNQEDREYAKREFEAYLGYAINSFAGVGNNQPNGLSNRALSLPHQWQKAASLNHLVPDFYWGPQALNTLKEKFNSLVYSEIYNYLNWSSKKSTLFDENHVFCFNKPMGTPLFLVILNTRIFSPELNQLPQKIQKNIQTQARQITQEFKSFSGELLFFIQGEKITFGCFNHEIIRLRQHNDFDDFIIENLIREYKKCLN